MRQLHLSQQLRKIFIMRATGVNDFQVSPPYFEYLSLREFNRLARDLAGKHTAISPKTNTAIKRVIASFNSDKREILAAYKILDKRTEPPVTATEQWLIDNRYLILETLYQLTDDLNYKLLSRLPVLKTNTNKIRIYEVLSQLIAHSNLQVSSKRITNFVSTYQLVTPLTIAELWAIPTVLHKIFMEHLCHIFQQAVENFNSGPKQLDNKIIRNIIMSLHHANKINWNNLFEQMSIVEKVLRKDPAGVYPKMDFQTRDTYRHVVEEIYYQTSKNQEEIAMWTIQQAQRHEKDGSQTPKNHVGYYLIGAGRVQLEQTFSYKRKLTENVLSFLTKRATFTYLSTLLIFWAVVFLAVALLIIFKEATPFTLRVLLSTLLITPSFYSGNLIANFMFVRLFRPRYLPKMDPELPIRANHRTMVVIPTLLLDNLVQPKELLEALELNYLANKDPNIFFSLLLSFPETTGKSGSLTDSEQQLFQELTERIETLNKKFFRQPNIFYLFLRERKWDPAEKSWLEWERKRGKLLEFNQLLRGSDTTSFVFKTADSAFLSTFKYVITIDRDVFLPKNSAKKLVATMSHPLNQPVVDYALGRVIDGYAIIQPRLVTLQSETNKSLAQKLFAGSSGWDSYSGLVSDVYQDLFHEGLYLGKGIYNIDVFNTLLYQRLPEHTLLSHDHIEGFYCRTGYAPDIQVFESYPRTYLSFISRLERWVRGDWQRLGWLFNYVPDENGKLRLNPFTFYQRWKLFEDALRSLTIPSIFCFIILCWLFLPDRSRLTTLVALGLIASQPAMVFIDSLLIKRNYRTWFFTLSNIAQDFKLFLLKWMFDIFFLCHQSIIISKAIAKALIRTLITKQKRLEWVTFHETSLKKVDSLKINFLSMSSVEIVSFLLFIIILAIEPESSTLSLPLILAWTISPLVAYYFSRPQKEKPPVLLPTQQEKLRILGRKTWRYFEDLVKGATHWLPPDHFQETIPIPVSTGVSITDIGFYLLSLIAAYDLGYINSVELQTKAHLTIQSLQKLKRYQGHFFNWYDLKTLKPLAPLYVSTVDSGNLAGSLLTLKQGLLELPDVPIMGNQVIKGLDDILLILTRLCLLLPKTRKVPEDITDGYRGHLISLRKCLVPLKPETINHWFLNFSSIKSKIERLKTDPLVTDEGIDKTAIEEILFWQSKLSFTINTHLTLLQSFAPWLTMTPKIKGQDNPTLLALDRCLTPNSLRQHYSLVLNQNKSYVLSTRLRRLIIKGHKKIDQFCNDCLVLSEVTGKLAEEMNFAFLYNAERNLFRVGYNFSRKSFDQSFYDLLSSEARLASFLAISKYDVPLKHWVALGRPMTTFFGRIALLSWGGSIFEYLFPLLIMADYKNTLLSETYETVIKSHIDYGRVNKIPWGMSESSYGLRNKDGHYRYKMHGVPYLGLRQTLFKELVVSPYSTFLALEIVPKEAYQNILLLQREGGEGLFGFYESLDYTTYKNLPSDRIVKTFLCHHQGAIIVTLANFLGKNQIKRRFSDEPSVKTSTFLLQEPAPSNPRLSHAAGKLPYLAYNPSIIEKREQNATPYATWQHHKAPMFGLISNGRYKVFLSNRGSGYSEYHKFTVTRWKNDLTFDDSGTFYFIRDSASGHVWSAAFLPTMVEPEKYDISFTKNSITITRQDQGIETKLDTCVLLTDDVEVQRLNINNRSRRERTLEITSYAEIVLGNLWNDIATPAFNKMQLCSEFVSSYGSLLFSRHLANKNNFFLGFKALASNLSPSETEFTTDRLKFIGRGRNIHNPLSVVSGRPLDKSFGFTLDQIASFRFRLRLTPESQKTIYYLSCISSSRQNVLDLIRKYSSEQNLVLALESTKKGQLGQLDRAADIELSCRFLSCLLLRRKSSFLKPSLEPRINLEYLGISDLPIATVKITSSPFQHFLRQFLRSCYFLSQRDFVFNVIILVKEEDGYFQEKYNLAQEIINEFDVKSISVNLPSPRIKLEKMGNFSPADVNFLLDQSSVTLDSSKGSLAKQLELEFEKT